MTVLWYVDDDNDDINDDVDYIEEEGISSFYPADVMRLKNNDRYVESTGAKPVSHPLKWNKAAAVKQIWTDSSV